MQIWLLFKRRGEPIVDPSQYEVMKTNFAITKAMSDEELKALEAYVYSHKIIHTELVSVSDYFLLFVVSLVFASATTRGCRFYQG
jgi:hypothetical protein